MRHASATERIRLRSTIAVAANVLFTGAICLLCGRMLYVAFAEQTTLALSRYVGWITYQSHPRWFVVSVVAYTLLLTLSFLWALACVLSLRREHTIDQRRRTAPPLDNAIRSDVNSR